MSGICLKTLILRNDAVLDSDSEFFIEHWVNVSNFDCLIWYGTLLLSDLIRIINSASDMMTMWEMMQMRWEII